MPDIFAQSRSALAELAEGLLGHARAAGASSARVTLFESAGLNAQLRQGRVKALSREVRSGASLTVYLGTRQGSTHSTDTSPQSLSEMAEAACAIARHTTEDAHAGLPDAALLCRAPQDLGLFHPWQPSSDELIDRARAIEAGIAEQAGQAGQGGGTQAHSDGVWASAGQSQVWTADSQGFADGFAESMHACSASVIAQRDQTRIREFWASVERRPQDMASPAEVGAQAAQRALALLDERPAGSGTYPVLFDARSATSLLTHLAQAISGRPLYLGTSFLGERFDSPIFAPHVDIVEDPLIPGGKASAPFDAEGVAGSQRALVEHGVLRGALLDSYGARRLGRRSTGNAGGCYNLRLRSTLTAAGDDAAAMLRKLHTGLLVTGLSGDGVRVINGDYSRVARGFWVEGGEIRHAVDGVTIAGNLLDMWRQILAVGADTFTEGAFTTGAILVEQMRVASR